MNQLGIEFSPKIGSHFKGETYEPKHDQARLERQLDRVVVVMADREWHTLAEIAEATGSPEASVSARLRDMRRPIHRKGLGLKIDRERVSRGLYRYRWGVEE